MQQDQQPHMVVSDDTKIKIWKQFTTLVYRSFDHLSCVWRHKDKNLKAIHNAFIPTLKSNFNVKTFWKDDDNNDIYKKYIKGGGLLWELDAISTINGVEQQQSVLYVEYRLPICLTQKSLKGLNAPGDVYIITDTRDVSDDTKIKIWKQFTTGFCGVVCLFKMCLTTQR